MTAWFDRFASWVSAYCGRVHAFALFLVSVTAWLAWGAARGFTDGMMAWMGAVSGIVSIALLIVLQNTQARGSAAVTLKIDELIRAIPDARNELIGIEAQGTVEIEAVRVTLHES